MPAALLSAPQTVTSQTAPPMLSEMMPHTSVSATTSVVSAVSHASTVASMEIMTESADEHAPLAGVKDPMNALWTFEGHQLRELQAADKNPNNHALHHQGLAHTDHLGKNVGAIDPTTGAMTTVVQREVDADGYPVLYGSCGRDKRYGRCSVCYFRGLRCNTAHYCACCQRPVCIRPRKYPGEEHHKICWNVLHMDKDMIQRVEKKKKRKLQALTAAPTASASVGVAASLRSKTIEEVQTGDGNGLNQSAEDLHRAPSIPTVVADVSGAYLPGLKCLQPNNEDSKIVLKAPSLLLIRTTETATINQLLVHLALKFVKASVGQHIGDASRRKEEVKAA
ncbi:unnamed protein product [Phytophthora fragariaefolia]|uniref:Unnamed protein product n=1 Tax=Phytophthora fragariaefolia TaxID=1490495 RepID=A0A9W6XT26_9STRA|nr:unnamed protein product [Phytophthora fragariaefolia]